MSPSSDSFSDAEDDIALFGDPAALEKSLRELEKQALRGTQGLEEARAPTSTEHHPGIPSSSHSRHKVHKPAHLAARGVGGNAERRNTAQASGAHTLRGRVSSKGSTRAILARDDGPHAQKSSVTDSGLPLPAASAAVAEGVGLRTHPSGLAPRPATDAPGRLTAGSAYTATTTGDQLNPQAAATRSAMPPSSSTRPRSYLPPPPPAPVPTKIPALPSSVQPMAPVQTVAATSGFKAVNRDDSDDYDFGLDAWAPAFDVTEDGRYAVSTADASVQAADANAAVVGEPEVGLDVEDVREGGGIAARRALGFSTGAPSTREATAPTPAPPAPGVNREHSLPPSAIRPRSLTRSHSLGGIHSPSNSRSTTPVSTTTGVSHRSSRGIVPGPQSAAEAARESPRASPRPPGATPSAFTRTQSVGASQARRAAILGIAASAAVAGVPEITAQAPGSAEGGAGAGVSGAGGFVSGLSAIREASATARPPPAATSDDSSRARSSIKEAAREAVGGPSAEKTPAAETRAAADAEKEALRKQIEQLSREKHEIEARSKEVTDNLYAARGEVATVRRHQQAVEAARNEAEAAMRQRIAKLQEEAAQAKQEHQREIEKLQVQAAFKAHNDTAPLRPRAPPTQKRPSETPFRSGRNSSQAPRGHFNAFETPSKARPGSQTRSLADGDTRTPGRMTTRLSASKAAATPDFQKLQNSFAAPATVRNVKRRRKGEPEVMATSSSPTRPNQPEEADVDDTMADAVEELEIGLSEEQERAMLLHLLFSHRHMSASSTTFYLLLHTQVPDSIETSDWGALCQGLLRLSGDLDKSLDAVILEISTILRRMLAILTFSRESDAVAALLDLLAATQDALPSWHLTADDASQRELHLLIDVVETFCDDGPRPIGWRVGTALTDLGIALMCDIRSLPSPFLRELFIDPKGLCALLESHRHEDVRDGAIQLVEAAAANGFEWKALSWPSPGNAARIPLFESLCNILNHSSLYTDSRHYELVCLRILNFFSLLTQADADSVVILSGNHHLVPSLIRLLNFASDAVYGLETWMSTQGALTIILSALSLLHYLAFPSPNGSTHEPRPGLELASCLQKAAALKEFDGLHEEFISAIGRIAYAEIAVDPASIEGWGPKQTEGLQFLAQDLLEIVVEGPEGDAIYEMYVVEPSNELQHNGMLAGAKSAADGHTVADDDSMAWDVIDVDAEEAATLAHGYLGSDI